MSSADVLHLLGISEASLARWRESNSFRTGYVSSNHVVYPFKDSISGQERVEPHFKGFRRLGGFAALNALQGRCAKGYMGESQTLFEEL